MANVFIKKQANARLRQAIKLLVRTLITSKRKPKTGEARATMNDARRLPLQKVCPSSMTKASVKMTCIENSITEDARQ